MNKKIKNISCFIVYMIMSNLYMFSSDEVQVYIGSILPIDPLPGDTLTVTCEVYYSSDDWLEYRVDVWLYAKELDSSGYETSYECVDTTSATISDGGQMEFMFYYGTASSEETSITFYCQAEAACGITDESDKYVIETKNWVPPTIPPYDPDDEWCMLSDTLTIDSLNTPVLTVEMERYDNDVPEDWFYVDVTNDRLVSLGGCWGYGPNNITGNVGDVDFSLPISLPKGWYCFTFWANRQDDNIGYQWVYLHENGSIDYSTSGYN